MSHPASEDCTRRFSRKPSAVPHGLVGRAQITARLGQTSSPCNQPIAASGERILFKPTAETRCELSGRLPARFQHIFFPRDKGRTVRSVTQTKLPALKPHADCRPTPDGPKAPGCPHLVTPSCSPATKRTPLRRHKREDSSISCTRLLEHCL